MALSCNKAAKMKPKRADLSFSAGNSLKDNGAHEEALKFFEHAHKTDPNNAKFLFAFVTEQRVSCCDASFRLAVF